MGSGVDQCLGSGGIAAQHLGQRVAGEHHHPARRIALDVAVVAVGDHLARDQVADRARAATLTVLEELDQHGGSSGAAGRARALRVRSMARSWVATTSASTSRHAPLAPALFSQRAT